VYDRAVLKVKKGIPVALLLLGLLVPLRSFYEVPKCEIGSLN